GSRAPGWTLPSPQMIARCEQLIELDRRLAAVANGDDESATAAERLGLAAFCQKDCKRLHRTAARLAAGAFAADVRGPQRYNAACSAALAAAGQAEDAKHLPDRERLMLRRQALAWLRDELAQHARPAGRDDPGAKEAVREALRHWRQDADLASVRDGDALARLPADERE